MNLSARMPTIVSSSTSSSPGKTRYEYQDPGESVVGNERSGKPDGFSYSDYSKWDYDRSWSSLEWRSEVTTHDRSGKLDRSSWGELQRVRPHHEDALLDGNAQSVRNEEKIHERLGNPIALITKKRQIQKIFVVGNDAKEFVNKVKDQVRKRQKSMSNVAEADEEHSIIWGMSMAARMSHWKELPGQSKFHQVFHRSNFEESVRHHRKNGERQEEIVGVDKINWRKIPGNNCH